MDEIGPEPERAIYALTIAAQLLEEAKDQAEESVFEQTIIKARDSMRIACSAILFKDGFIAPDLDSSCNYLRKKYGERIPINEWKHVEQIAKGNPIEKISSFLGFGKNTQQENAKKALEVAGKFLDASNSLIVE
jgi:hypothetical protein